MRDKIFIVFGKILLLSWFTFYHQGSGNGIKWSPEYGEIFLLLKEQFVDVGKDSRNIMTDRQFGLSLSSPEPCFRCQCVILQQLRFSGLLSLKLCIIFHCHLVTDTKAGIKKYATVMQEIKLLKINFSWILSYRHLNS